MMEVTVNLEIVHVSIFFSNTIQILIANIFLMNLAYIKLYISDEIIFRLCIDNWK